MTTFVILLACVPLVAFIASPLFRNRIKTGGRVLALHSLKPQGLDFGAVSVDTFQLLIDLIHANGLSVGTIAEAAGNSGSVAITFDDGYDDLLGILPIVVAEGMPVTVFYPTAFIGKKNSWDSFLMRGRRRHLTEEEIKKLASAGVHFGSHGHTHRDLSRLSEVEIERELATSKEILQTLTGRTVDYIAYPFGRWNQRVVAIARKLDFHSGLTSVPSHGEPFNIGRIAVNRLDSRLSLEAKLKPGIMSGLEYLRSLIISLFSRVTPISTALSRRAVSR